jgi:hypothetical protein
MIEIVEPATGESACEIPDRLTENGAVARCVCAWQITMKNERAELDEDESEYEAEQEAKAAFIRAMPPLSGYENICDFFVCVTNASTADGISHRDAEHFLAAAKVALGVLRLEVAPAGSARRGPGLLRKLTSKERENELFFLGTFLCDFDRNSFGINKTVKKSRPKT